ncbi:MAG: hypothetical protein V1790_00895 [Planctomycetota bacterium]
MIAALQTIPILAQMPSAEFQPRLTLLLIALVVCVAYVLVKSLLPELLRTVLMIPIFEEIGTKVGLFDIIFLWIIQLSVPWAFWLTTIIFVALHVRYTADRSLIERLFRAADATYIGVICLAWYAWCAPHGTQVFGVVCTCIVIHAVINLVICLLKQGLLIALILQVVRALLCFLYLYQALQFMGQWRKMIVPFFLHAWA